MSHHNFPIYGASYREAPGDNDANYQQYTNPVNEAYYAVQTMSAEQEVVFEDAREEIFEAFDRFVHDTEDLTTDNIFGAESRLLREIRQIRRHRDERIAGMYSDIIPKLKMAQDIMRSAAEQESGPNKN